ncbi:flagellar hook-basal body complex protein FliE [Halalkalibacterium halodurans]|uniref:flagellar hook-basal body complex protein FliE n=1 Tax=Halalkalibacterium halodurans TaxID=86665 RepID=UPI001068513F|nr:flagellar hook-basal body complex protein FliE [Halalkalibacterium halodurans]MED3646676.1 flagellar hook-basal body complex protein FliE [Halalkalibacterium halodurans]TES56914.1 flagellar hook-basal body complex protein FliE [Halalkalibacterium halodurans]
MAEIQTVTAPVFLNQANSSSVNKHTPAEAQETFKQALSQAINNVNDLQKVSAEKTELLAKGKIKDLHDVMITGQKASITLSATVEIRNKVIEAYQEIMRMQV